MDKLDLTTLILSICGIASFLFTILNGIFRRGTKEKGIEDRVITLEGEFKEVATDIKTIKENHLAHIQTSINDININLSSINTTLTFLKEK